LFSFTNEKAAPRAQHAGAWGQKGRTTMVPATSVEERIAIHEAAHAVLAYLNGVKFEVVSIEPNDCGFAKVELSDCEREVFKQSRSYLDVDWRRRVEWHIISLLAGFAADWRLTGIEPDWENTAGNDKRVAKQLIRLEWGPPKADAKQDAKFDAEFDRLLGDTRQLMQCPDVWRKIKRVADTLQREKSLSETTVADLCEQTA
jgi:hypothetical protein